MYEKVISMNGHFVMLVNLQFWTLLLPS